MAWRSIFFPKNLEIGDAGGLAALGVDAFDAHLFEHPLTVDFLGRDDFEAFCEAAVEVVAFHTEECGGLFVDPHPDDAVLGGPARGRDFNLPGIARAHSLRIKKAEIFPIEKTQGEVFIGDEPTSD